MLNWTILAVVSSIAALVCSYQSRPRFTCVNAGDPGCGRYGRKASGIRWCGETFSNDTSERIINGVESKPQEFPWMAKIWVNGYFFCGGSLISNNYVVTAGHCVATHLKGSSELPKALRGNVKNFNVVSPDKVKVDFGVFSFQDHNPPVTSQVLKIVLHPRYDVFVSHEYMMQTNDIAVLRIQPIRFSQAILPVCLPKQGGTVSDGSLVTVAGWGLVQEGSEEHNRTPINPEVLMKNTMQKISWRQCRDNPLSRPFLSPENSLTDRHILCLMGMNTDACQGDSGGGVVQRTTQGFVLQGIVSWGIGCNRKNFPSGYTRVSSYVNFIHENTRDTKYLPMKPRGDNWKRS